MSEYTYTTCWKCREKWSVRSELIELAKRSGTALYCPFGHAGYWKLGKTDKELLEEQLDAERRRRQSAEQNIEWQRQQRVRAERSAIAYKGQATKLRNRAKAGICPCCKRHFVQLERHMASKHPAFASSPDTELPTDVSPILSERETEDA